MNAEDLRDLQEEYRDKFVFKDDVSHSIRFFYHSETFKSHLEKTSMYSIDGGLTFKHVLI